jgi:hypothetical protein
MRTPGDTILAVHRRRCWCTDLTAPTRADISRAQPHRSHDLSPVDQRRFAPRYDGLARGSAPIGQVRVDTRENRATRRLASLSSPSAPRRARRSCVGWHVSHDEHAEALSHFQPGIPAMYACTAASPSTLAMRGLLPESTTATPSPFRSLIGLALPAPGLRARLRRGPGFRACIRGLLGLSRGLAEQPRHHLAMGLSRVWPRLTTELARNGLAPPCTEESAPLLARSLDDGGPSLGIDGSAVRESGKERMPNGSIPLGQCAFGCTTMTVAHQALDNLPNGTQKARALPRALSKRPCMLSNVAERLHFSCGESRVAG